MASVESKFSEWARNKSGQEARIAIYQSIRDIPYAIIPELNDPEKYREILVLNKGSCTPKHFLLREMYELLGLETLYAVYPFRWDELEIEYPPSLRKLARRLPLSYHLACRVDIHGKLVLVDATVDLPLEKLGLPVNKTWDGLSDTLLPIKPCGEELYHPGEARQLQPPRDEVSLAFFQELNRWLEEVRSPSAQLL